MNQHPPRSWRVYIQGNGEYQLRGFEESRDFSPSEVESIADQYSHALLDTAHSI